MIFTCNASRLAIYISWGHRNNNFFSNIHLKNDFLPPDLSPLDKSVSKIKKKNLSLYRQKVPKSCLGRFMGIVFEESVSQNSIS